MWVVLTPTLHAYAYREGYVRTAAVPLDLTEKNKAGQYDPMMHLCNNAIQKNGPSYGAREDGNQMSFSDLQAIIDLESKPKGKHKSYGCRIRFLVFWRVVATSRYVKWLVAFQLYSKTMVA